MVTITALDPRRNNRVDSKNAKARVSRLENFHRLLAQGKLSRREISLRTTQVEQAWSCRERADRLRAGDAASAWFSSLLDSQNN